jgi:hypothetical protein
MHLSKQGFGEQPEDGLKRLLCRCLMQPSDAAAQALPPRHFMSASLFSFCDLGASFTVPLTS